MKLTDEQVNELKKINKLVYCVEVEDTDELDTDGKAIIKRAYLKRPTLKDLEYITNMQGHNLMALKELIKSIWLAGDADIQENDSLLIAVLPQLEAILEQKKSRLVKL